MAASLLTRAAVVSAKAAIDTMEASKHYGHILIICILYNYHLSHDIIPLYLFSILPFKQCKSILSRQSIQKQGKIWLFGPTFLVASESLGGLVKAQIAFGFHPEFLIVEDGPKNLHLFVRSFQMILML